MRGFRLVHSFRSLSWGTVAAAAGGGRGILSVIFFSGFESLCGAARQKIGSPLNSKYGHSESCFVHLQRCVNTCHWLVFDCGVSFFPGGLKSVARYNILPRLPPPPYRSPTRLCT